MFSACMGVPMLRIEPGNAGLGVPAVVVFKSPVPRGGIGKSPAFQFSTVSRCLRCCSAASRSIRCALWQSHSAGGGQVRKAFCPPGSRLLWACGIFRSTANRPRLCSPPLSGSVSGSRLIFSILFINFLPPCRCSPGCPVSGRPFYHSLPRSAGRRHSSDRFSRWRQCSGSFPQ